MVLKNHLLTTRYLVRPLASPALPRLPERGVEDQVGRHVATLWLLHWADGDRLRLVPVSRELHGPPCQLVLARRDRPEGRLKFPLRVRPHPRLTAGIERVGAPVGVEYLDVGVRDRPPVDSIADHTAGNEVAVVGAAGQNQGNGGNQRV